MPFFLVIQTSLVEAQDEHTAAQKGIDRLRAGGQVTVAVKSDETTVTQIVVAAKVDAVSTTKSIERPAVAPQVPVCPPVSRKLILRRMMADALTLMGRGG